MQVIEKTPTQLIIQTSSAWRGWLFSSVFIGIGLWSMRGSNWIFGSVFLLCGLFALATSKDEIYILDKTLGKITVKRWGLRVNDVTKRSTSEISAVKLDDSQDSEGNRSYYIYLLMLGGDRICLSCDSISHQHKMADLIRSYLDGRSV